MGSKKVFTKMDLQWGFNNVRIKKGNEWKGLFTMHGVRVRLGVRGVRG